MDPAYRIDEVRAASDFAALGALFGEYQRHIGVDLCFQDFDAELANLAGIYAPPHGAALLVRTAIEAAPAGCVALKRLASGVCEMKRLYVRPQHRGAGLGRALVEACMRRARELGYSRIRLDTLASMTAAQALYRSLGFADIEPYYCNPHPGTRFMECVLANTIDSSF